MLEGEEDEQIFKVPTKPTDKFNKAHGSQSVKNLDKALADIPEVKIPKKPRLPAAARRTLSRTPGIQSSTKKIKLPDEQPKVKFPALNTGLPKQTVDKIRQDFMDRRIASKPKKKKRVDPNEPNFDDIDDFDIGMEYVAPKTPPLEVEVEEPPVEPEAPRTSSSERMRRHKAEQLGAY